MKILYKFVFENKPMLEFEIEVGRGDTDPQNAPEWTNLEFNQCPNCPLQTGTTSHCPPAVDVAEAMTNFKDILSTEIVETWVESPDRVYYKKCDAQTALRALTGLIMATSKCPILREMKGLAYFHLPFASLEETIFRGVCNYFMKQYYKLKNGEETNWELSSYGDFYNEVSQVNASFFERIKVASQADSNLNTIVSLSSVSNLMGVAVDEYMENFRELFEETHKG